MHSVVRRFAAAAAAVLFLFGLVASTATAAAPTWSHRDVNVCGPAGVGNAACASVARVLYQDGVEFHAASPQALGNAARPAASVSYSAIGIRKAYGITGSGDPSRVIAIVDAYDDTNAYAHLSTYRSSMGLPAINACSLSTLTGLASSASSPCFAKVNQNGGTSLPAANSGWANEEDLDLQAASAMCPMCSIVLFEAASASFADLGTAVTTASSTAHVLAISNSYSSSGDAAGATYPAWDNAAKKGIAVMASTGDSGYGVGFPASATNVLGVGGTNVQVDGSGARSSETAWSGAGSGCSTYNAAPSWQVISGSPCGTRKAIADLSADADPGSGLQVYTTYRNVTGWYIFGGTSLSSPLIGAYYAMQGGYGAALLAGAYAWAGSTSYFDVTSGTNGSCSPSVLCTAGAGWDGPTGRGSIASASAAPVLTTITVSPPSASVATGGTQQFTALGYDQSHNLMSPQPAFSWSVSGGGSIDQAGLFTAGTAGGGPYTVTASSGSVSGTASVTVTTPQTLTSIAVTPPSASVAVGSTQQFTATELDQNGNPMATQPSSYSWGVSGGGSINGSGLFTASAAGGPYTVTASASGLSGTASVTVTQAAAGDFTISASPGSRSIKGGASTSYTIAITRTNFSGSVSLSLAGMPSGATFSFSPASTTGTSSTLTVGTSKATPRGTYTLTITGTDSSGALSHATTVGLKIR